MTGRESPVFSVVMPVRDGEETVAAATDSILDQTLSDFEFLIVDDCSRDRTAEILAGYARADARIRILAGAGRGHAAARNVGMEAAKGRYVAAFDADDLAMRNRLERQLALLEREPDLAGVGSDAMLFVRPGEGLGLSSCNAPSTRDALARLMQRGEVVIFKSSSIVWDADRLRQAGGYREGVLSDDAELTNRMLYQYGWPMLAIPEPLVWWRLNACSVSSQTAVMQREYRWLQARNKAWLMGRVPPELETFLMEPAEGWFTRLRWWRSMKAETLYRRAGRAAGLRRWIEAGVYAAGAFTARPSFVVRRLWVQRVRAEARRHRRRRSK